MLAADFCPGPTNQKSVPGPWHSAVASPPAFVCSASSPRARAPLASIITPPRPAPVGTPAAVAVVDCRASPRASAGAWGTFSTDRRPGWVRTCSGAGAVAAPAGVSRVTLACPVPVEAATSATLEAVTPAEPGPGHARTTLDTTARAWPGARWPAVMAAEWLTLARTNSAATDMTTSSPSRYLFAKSRLTGRHLASRAPGWATRASPHRHLARGDGVGCPDQAATGRARRCGRPASRTDPAPTSRGRCSTDRSGRAAATSPTGTAAPRPAADCLRARYA